MDGSRLINSLAQAPVAQDMCRTTDPTSVERLVASINQADS
jgi:hypothetical protein